VVTRVLTKDHIAGGEFFAKGECDVTSTSLQHGSLLQQWGCNAVINFLQHAMQ